MKNNVLSVRGKGLNQHENQVGEWGPALARTVGVVDM